PLGGKDQDSGIRKVVERDPTQGIELKETHTQRVPQRRRRIHGGESELRKTNSCVSFVVCLTTLSSSICFIIPHRSTLVCCFCVCRDLQYIHNNLQEHYIKLY